MVSPVIDPYLEKSIDETFFSPSLAVDLGRTLFAFSMQSS
jgi:hypothetical protein